MTYFLIALFCLFLIIFIILYSIKKKRVIYQVKHMKTQEKLHIVNKALNPFGFTFDIEEDIVISSHDSWQRDMGYSDFFDLKAPFINIVMDCEPIYFDYNNKHYRIEFWKGQYGITTGAEVGIYIEEKKGIYRSANDDECLPISMELYKKCLVLKRKDYTWWLTGFDVGTFSRPKNLILKVCLRFPNQQLQVAFIKGLLNAGYNPHSIAIYGSIVCFTICKPKNISLNCKHKIIKCFVQILNFINCHLFLWFTKPFIRTLDKLTYIRFMAPHLYKFVIKLSIPKRKQKKYKKC